MPVATAAAYTAGYGVWVCGRYASTRSTADLATLFEAFDETDGALSADYNIAPTDPVAIVRRTGRRATPVVCVARWGLVPAWARDASGAARMINARAETVATSRAFAPSFAQRRCLIPADGWYEWVAPGDSGPVAPPDVRAPRQRSKTVRTQRQPFYMTRFDGGALAFGGVWSAWESETGPRLSFSILTLPAEGDLALVHHRMPLVLEPARWERWLQASDPTALLVAPPRDYLEGIERRAVSPAVGDVRNDGPELVRPIALARPADSTVDSSAPTLF